MTTYGEQGTSTSALIVAVAPPFALISRDKLMSPALSLQTFI
jgi:hypothetical protein